MAQNCGEYVSISKDRYQELLEYERFVIWTLNSIVVDSLPHIELTKQKIGELSNDEKLKSIKAAFNEALKQKRNRL